MPNDLKDEKFGEGTITFPLNAVYLFSKKYCKRTLKLEPGKKKNSYRINSVMLFIESH